MVGHARGHQPPAQRARRAMPVILTIKWGHLLRFDPVELAAWIDGYRRRPRGPQNDW